MIVIPITDIAFDDAAIRAMGKAFDQACKSLRNFGSACAVREVIAKRIIDAAKNGERDPIRLSEQALIPFGIEDMSMWPAPGSEDTELGVLMGPEVRHGEAKVYARVQA